jgi:PAS domain S-box-containing protein
VAILMRDITADMQRHRLADVKSAILKAMSVHGAMAYARVSVRGFIEVVDDGFCRIMGLPSDRLTKVAMADLVELPVRPLFRAQLDKVLRGDGDQRIATRLLTNGGSVAPVEAAIARLHGIYGTEGAIILMTLATLAENA